MDTTNDIAETSLSPEAKAELYYHSGKLLLAAQFFQQAGDQAGGHTKAANLYVRAKRAAEEHAELMRANSNQKMNTQTGPTNSESLGDRQFLRGDFLGAAEQYRRAAKESADYGLESHYNTKASKALEVHDAMMKASAPKSEETAAQALYLAAKKLRTYYQGGATLKEKADAWSELNAALFDCENPK